MSDSSAVGPVDFSKFTAREWAAGLRMAADTTPDHSLYAWVNPDGVKALADFLSDLANRGVA